MACVALFLATKETPDESSSGARGANPPQEENHSLETTEMKSFARELGLQQGSIHRICFSLHLKGQLPPQTRPGMSEPLPNPSPRIHPEPHFSGGQCFLGPGHAGAKQGPPGIRCTFLVIFCHPRFFGGALGQLGH